MLTNSEFQSKLEETCPGFAYQVMLLEIAVEGDNPSFEDLTRLVELYMLAVGLLEGQSDDRFEYFNRKILKLMVKQPVLQQIGTDKSCIKQTEKPVLSQRKDAHVMNVLLHTQTESERNSVQAIVQKEEAKLSSINSILVEQAKIQQRVLQERIENRRRRSTSHSKSKDKKMIGSFKTLLKPVVQSDVDREYFTSPEIGPLQKASQFVGKFSRLKRA